MRLDPRVAAVSGMIAPAAEIMLIIILGWLTPGYQHSRDVISKLGAEGSGYETLTSIVFVATGLLFLILAYGLYEKLPGNLCSRVFAVLIGFFGVFSCVGSGLFPCSSGCQGGNVLSTIHVITNFLAFTALTVSPMFLFLGARRSRWHGLQPLNMAVQVLGLVFFALFAVNYGPDAGFYQRLYLAVYYLWIVAVSMELYELSE